MKKQNLDAGSKFPDIYSPLDEQKAKGEPGPVNDFGFPEFDAKDPLNIVPDRAGKK